jgi:type II secretory pathway pseudopilin PulG
MRARGAVLLECVLALAILVSASMLLLGMATRAAEASERARLTEQAADLARSTLARLEIGEMTLERASGPVTAWRDPNDTSFSDDLPDESSGGSSGDSGWRIHSWAEPSPFAGLTIVTVEATHRYGGGDGGGGASAQGGAQGGSADEVRFALTRVMRLGGREGGSGEGGSGEGGSGEGGSGEGGGGDGDGGGEP